MNTRYSTPERVCAVFYVFRARQKPQMSGFGAALSFCADLPDSAEKKSPAVYCTPKVGHFWGVFYEI